MLLGECGRSTPSGKVEECSVYRTRSDKFVVHLKRSDERKATGGWRGAIGLSESGWGVVKGTATLKVVDTLDELKEKIPAELFEIVTALANEPAVEDLDI